MAIKLICLLGDIWCPSIGSWLIICRTLSSLETWDHLYPMHLNGCMANRSERNSTRVRNVLLRTPHLLRRKNSVSTASTRSPRSCPEIPAAGFLSSHRSCKGSAHLHGVPWSLTQLHCRASSPDIGCFLIFLQRRFLLPGYPPRA